MMTGDLKPVLDGTAELGFVVRSVDQPALEH